jgi:hypothetical protein
MNGNQCCRSYILPSGAWAACLAASLLTAAWAQPGPPPSGPPPGAPPSGGTATYYAAYKLDGGADTQANQSYTATGDDTSGVWVTNAGSLTLVNPTITTTGNTSSQDNSSFYGLNAGLLATAGGKVTVTGGAISTTGTGANGAFATGAASSVTLTDVTINATADGGHAVMATQTGTMTLTNVNMTRSGGSSSAIATDRGGGTITVTGGQVRTAGMNSAGIYSTGAITVNGATMQSTGAEMAVIEGANSITLTDTSLTSTKEKWGVMIYQSMSGDAQGTEGTFTATGGSLTYTPGNGPLFYVTNSTGIINLKGVAITAASGLLLRAAAGNWGNAGSKGGTAVLTADGQTLTGDLEADAASRLSVTLQNNSSLTGKVTGGSVTLDATSRWTVTGDSAVTGLTGALTIAGSEIYNIVGNGHTVTYDPTLEGNLTLAGLTYYLKDGGELKPSTR